VKRNVSVILGGPYNSGILTGGVTDQATHDYAQAPAPADRQGAPGSRRSAGATASSSARRRCSSRCSTLRCVR
jgi:hypothetical protein